MVVFSAKMAPSAAENRSRYNILYKSTVDRQRSHCYSLEQTQLAKPRPNSQDSLGKAYELAVTAEDANLLHSFDAK